MNSPEKPDGDDGGAEAASRRPATTAPHDPDVIVPEYVCAPVELTTWCPAIRATPPAAISASLTHGDPGPVTATLAEIAPTTSSLAWLSGPVDPEDGAALTPFAPFAVGVSTGLDVARIPDHSSTHTALPCPAPVPAVNVTTTEVWPPAQFQSTQISQSVSALLFWDLAAAQLPAAPPRVIPETVGFVVSCAVPM
jgi:hypothetical protein